MALSHGFRASGAALRTAFSAAFILAPAALATTFQVNSTVDAVDAQPGDGKCATAAGQCTLRAAIQEANAHAGPDSIMLPAGTYTLSIAGPAEDAAATGDLDITDDLVLSGAGAAVTIVDGAQLDRVFHVDPAAKGVSAELRGITIRNGKTQPIPYVSPDGAGVLLGVPYTQGGPYPSGSLTLADCIVRDNFSSRYAGGLANISGTMALVRTQVLANVAGFAGGIVNGDLGKLSLLDSTVADNEAVGDAGGIWSGFFDTVNATSVSILSSTISGNKAGYGSGGGLFISRGTLAARNCTVSGNTAGGPGSYGGGVNISGQGTLVNCTITGNVSSLPNSGGWGAGIAGGVGLTLENTLVAGNTTVGLPADCSGTLTSGGHNLIGTLTGCALTGNTQGNIVGKDPLLAPLADNGGPTLTHELLPGSPAIDAGDPAPPGSGGTACPATDQRGFSRPRGGSCDIGAVERLDGFRVTGMLPRSGGNAGSVLALVSGGGFTPGATAKLSHSGQPDVPASRLTVSSEGLITASFDLNGIAVGSWDVVVTQKNGDSAILPGGFTVEAVRAPDLWLTVLGPTRGRPGGIGGYLAVFGNRGNVDALGVPLSISGPGGLVPVVRSPVLSPPQRAGQPTIDWSVAHLDVTPDTNAVNIPLLLADVPAESSGAVFFTVSLPGSAHSGDPFQFEVALGTPYFTSTGTLDPTVRDGFVIGAEQFASEILGVTIGSDRAAELTQTVTDQLQAVIDVGRAAAVDGTGVLPVFSVGQLAMDQAVIEVLRINPRPVTAPPRLVAARSPLQSGGGGQTPPAPCVVSLPNGGVCPAGCMCTTPSPRVGPPPLPSDCKNLQDVLDGKCKLSKDMCEAMPGFRVSSDGDLCIPDKCTRSKPAAFNPDPSCRVYPIRAVISRDPNDKSGPQGAGDAHYVSPSLPLVYDIEFENAPSATAPAQVVEIQDPLDASLVDLNSLALVSVQLGETVVQLEPGVMPYTATVDLRASQNLLVRLDAILDRGAGTLAWHLTSLDPNTLETVSDPLAGFLPPNSGPPAGEGSVTFSVMPKAGLTTGTQICNQASIVFDTNAPLPTQPFCNIIDASKPVSHVEPLPARQSATIFTVSWSGTDEGSGILDYTVFVSEDGEAPTPWISQTTETSATFTGQTGKSYAFFSLARDQVGNAQDMPATPDTNTKLVSQTGSPAPSSKSGCGATAGGRGTDLLSVLAVAGWLLGSRVSRRIRRSRG
jgi:CSLREA domain-containing protein